MNSVGWAGVEDSQMGQWIVVGRGDRDRIPGLSDLWMAGVIGWVSQDTVDQQGGFHLWKSHQERFVCRMGRQGGLSVGENGRGRALLTRTVGHQSRGGQRR